VTQSIQKVEYSIGTYASAQEAILTQLEPLDGVLDTSIEEVSAILDTKSLEKGQYKIYARAQDSDGNWGVMSSLILRIDPDVVTLNTPPSASFSYICEDLLCQFDASESVDAQGIASYKWHINGGAALHGKIVYFPYWLTTEHKVELEVIDTYGLITTLEKTVAVEGVIEPVAAFEVACEGLVCTFDASTSSDEDGEIIQTTWVIDDVYFGQDPLTTTFEYTFEVAGEHNVSVEVIDNHHIFNSMQKTINVAGVVPVVVPDTAAPERKSSTSGTIIWLGLMLIISAFFRKKIYVNSSF